MKRCVFQLRHFYKWRKCDVASRSLAYSAQSEGLAKLKSKHPFYVDSPPTNGLSHRLVHALSKSVARGVLVRTLYWVRREASSLVKCASGLLTFNLAGLGVTVADERKGSIPGGGKR